MNNPDFLRLIIAEARRVDSTMFRVVLPAGSPEARTISEEKASIEKLMGDKNSDYWKGPRAQGLRERYVELIEDEQGAN